MRTTYLEEICHVKTDVPRNVKYRREKDGVTEEHVRGDIETDNLTNALIAIFCMSMLACDIVTSS
jgi:hypothetical protein